MIEIEKGKIKDLSQRIGVSERFAELLIRRGFDDVESANAFLYPSRDALEDPFRLTGMREAADRIRAAIDGGEKIVVYGDYDCDGITATAILVDYLSSVGADVDYFIPNRFDTGYGLSTETLEEIAERISPDLIVTVDCGVSSVSEAEYAIEVLGIDLVVTDHHILPDVLPDTVVVNPRLDPTSASTDLCGAGVAYKLVTALGGEAASWKYIEIAAIGTIADVVPLTRENRLIASLGIKKIRSREPINKGLRMLIEAAGCRREELTASDVGFYISPRINALGRIEECSEVVTLFTTEEYVVLQGLIEKLDRVNELRKSLVERELAEAIEMMKDYDLIAHKVIMLCDPKWNAGVLGLVAGRLKDRFHRPVVLLTGEDELRGSCRSPEGVDMVATLKAAESVLMKYGGHSRAAGLSVERANVIAARDLMDAYLERTCSNEVFSRSESYDLDLSPEEVTLSFADEVSLFEPTGAGNPAPKFRFDSAVAPLAPFGTGAHAKCRLWREGEIVAFRQAPLAEAIASGATFDLVCNLSKNVFNNRATAQMCVREVFPRELTLRADDPSLFNRYLRSNLYKEEPCASTAIEASRLADALYDDDFCTQFIAFSNENADLVRRDPVLASKVRKCAYGSNDDNPWNEVIFAPEDDAHLGYKRIVLLDTPLSTGYAARLVKNTGAELFVVKDRYPFADFFRRADLSADAIGRTFEGIRRFLFAGGRAISPLDLMRKVEPNDVAFLLRFYVLYESGSIAIGQNFSLSPSTLRDHSASTLYLRTLALKKRL
ncbi:MAG: single-stranded-DNA-specific exonuclease RecJ [Clostridia bacterium]|nr:single-stranded-DNA-specific exonuclease RecJ [Clostridia bacterium]